MCGKTGALKAATTRVVQAKNGALPGPPAPGGAPDAAAAEPMTRALNRMRNPRSRGLLKS